jgi:micrococcal nuclease
MGEQKKKVNYVYKAKVVKVYDGDTVTLDIKLGCFVTLENEKCRLMGIDTPEMRGEEKVKGKLARDFLRSMILGEEVIVRTYLDKTGKYGRLLVDIYHGDVHINEFLVTSGYAIEASY